jgi:hypothetical protein
MKKIFYLTVVTSVLVFLCGCNNRTIKTSPVSGVVRMNNKTLENVTVTFHNQNGTRSYGVTDSSGQFRLTTFKKNDGAPIGKGYFTITSNESVEPGLDPPPDSLIVKLRKYSSPDTSGLEFEVKPESNKFDIQLDATE